jgi:hypothetical protein
VEERLTWNLSIGTAMILIGRWIAERNSDERREHVETPRRRRQALAALPARRFIAGSIRARPEGDTVAGSIVG